MVKPHFNKDTELVNSAIKHYSVDLGPGAPTLLKSPLS